MNLEKKSFLMLLSLNATNAAVGRAFMERIKKDVDANASPLWIDSHGIGVFISSDLPAWKIWAAAWPESLTNDQKMTLKDVLLVQVGPDWAGPSGAKHTAWLNSRFPKN